MEGDHVWNCFKIPPHPNEIVPNSLRKSSKASKLRKAAKAQTKAAAVSALWIRFSHCRIGVKVTPTSSKKQIGMKSQLREMNGSEISYIEYECGMHGDICGTRENLEYRYLSTNFNFWRIRVVKHDARPHHNCRVDAFTGIGTKFSIWEIGSQKFPSPMSACWSTTLSKDEEKPKKKRKRVITEAALYLCRGLTEVKV